MTRSPKLVIAVATLALAAIVRADPRPDPTDFMANMTAFAEMCATRYPEMSDTPVLLRENMTADDRKLYDETRRSAAFAPALDKARRQLAGTPADKVGNMCKLMHDGLKKLPD